MFKTANGVDSVDGYGRLYWCRRECGWGRGICIDVEECGNGGVDCTDVEVKGDCTDVEECVDVEGDCTDVL